MKIINRFEEKGRLFWTFAGFILVLAVGFLDVITGYELAFSLFYLLPISLATWFGSRAIGITITILSAVSWFTADNLAGHIYSNPAIPFANTTIRFSVFLIVALLISALREAYKHEKEMARIDILTGAINRRYFSELLNMEIDRSGRNKKAFSVVYFDLDNFKKVNDTMGHAAGDNVLKTTVKEAKGHLRKIDIVARLGGDEFALLLPETGQEEARVAVLKIQSSILTEMKRNKWPVTLSIGVLTCITMSAQPEELVKQADELMYSVKKNGKNSVSYKVYS